MKSKHNLVYPHTPQQNGVVDEKNLNEIVQTLLLHNHVSHRFC